MQVLIVESDAALGALWKAHLLRQGAAVAVAGTEDAAVRHLLRFAVDVIVLDLVLTAGSALAVADFASYRRPGAKVLFVTNTTFFSDGSIFRHIPNACGLVGARTSPEDLAAMVEHHGRAA